jgi:hypothetical protein
VEIRVVSKKGTKNLADYWRIRKKARKKGKPVAYLELEMLLGREVFEREISLCGYLRPDGLIEIKPVNEADADVWEIFVRALFDYGGDFADALSEVKSLWCSNEKFETPEDLSDLGIEL